MLGARQIAANIADTYFQIGQQCPEVECFANEKIVCCRSRRGFPTGNFAFLLEPCAESVEFLRSWVTGKKPFYFYIYTSPETAFDESLLTAHRARHCSSLFNYEGMSPVADANLKWIRASDPEHRLQAASFMAQQFFHFQSQEIRDVVAISTSQTQLELLECVIGRQRSGAVMINRAHGMIGVYNLCVANSLRGRGYGSQMLGSLLHTATIENQPVVLQCESQLRSWYEKFGMKNVGKVDVWCLESP